MSWRDKGLRREEITNCISCGNGLMHDNQIAAYKVTVAQYIADTRAIQRQHGLELMLGNPALAQIMGTDDNLFKQVQESTGLLCQNCFCDPDLSLGETWEKINTATANVSREEVEAWFISFLLRARGLRCKNQPSY